MILSDEEIASLEKSASAWRAIPKGDRTRVWCDMFDNANHLAARPGWELTIRAYRAGCGLLSVDVDIPALLAELKAARKVVAAARAYSDAVEQGFAAKVRPDIARASLNRSLAEYDAHGGAK